MKPLFNSQAGRLPGQEFSGTTEESSRNSSPPRAHSPLSNVLSGEVKTLSSQEQPSAQQASETAIAASGTESATDRLDRSPSQGRSFPSEEIIEPLFPVPRKSKFSKWLWIGLLVSLGLHAVLFLIPTGNEPKPAPPKPQEKQVRITQLPKLIKTVSAPKKAKPAVKPVVRPRSAPPIPQPKAPPKPQAASTAAPTSSGSTAWDDFPIYPGSEPGCFGLASCLKTGDALSQVSEYFSKELPLKKYEVKPSLSDATRKVFQVSRNGQTQFLSVIQSDKGTVYVLSDAPRSLEDLKKAVEVPPEVAAILGNLDAQSADPSLFAQSDLFYTKSTEKGLGAGALVPKPGARNISLVPGQSFETLMDEFFRSNLQNNDFEIIDLPQPYGGGKVYQLKKESLTIYLNLVPTKDGSGTLVVVWKDAPK